MESIRISQLNHNGYETFFIPDIEWLLLKMKMDPCVAKKYKEMNVEEFKNWAEKGVTPKQFAKLQSLNNLLQWSVEDDRRDV